MYLGAAIVLPLLHAEDEVLWSQPSYEAHHTDGCRVIHSEAGCPTHHHYANPELAARRLVSLAGPVVQVPAPATDHPVGALLVLLLRTRAPPIA